MCAIDLFDSSCKVCLRAVLNNIATEAVLVSAKCGYLSVYSCLLIHAAVLEVMFKYCAFVCKAFRVAWYLVTSEPERPA